MIPSFPEFRGLTPSDKPRVEAFTGYLPPYSDFNFTSLWCWDVAGGVLIAQLNGNLVVRFTDYVTGEAFYSFCGGHSATQTAITLLNHAKDKRISPVLKHLPPESASNLCLNRFSVCEDRDHFDYILCVDAMNSFQGNRLRGQRNHVNRFRRQNHTTTRELDLTAHSIHQQIEDLLDRWVRAKQLSPEEIGIEFSALRRFFDYHAVLECLALGVFEGERLIGFSISEVLNGAYAMIHFEKGDKERSGIYPYLMQETARRLAAHGCRYINFQQDLGIEGLRRSKSNYQPRAYLKKYRVTERGL